MITGVVQRVIIEKILAEEAIPAAEEITVAVVADNVIAATSAVAGVITEPAVAMIIGTPATGILKKDIKHIGRFSGSFDQVILTYLF